MINSTDYLGLWGRSHFYTELLLSYASGSSADDAFVAGYWAQYPDQFIATDAYSLTVALEFGTNRKSIAQFLNGTNTISQAELKKWTVDVQNWIHGLSGGDANSIASRRECLRKLYDSGKLQPWEKGFIRHALGDTYAHVTDRDGKLVPYNPFIGHALGSIGEIITGGLSDTDPDQIFNSQFQYRNYVTSESSTTGSDARPWILKMLKERIPKIPEGDDEEITYLRKFTEAVTGNRLRWTPGDMNRLGGPKFHPPSRQDIESLIEKMKGACCK